MYFLFICILSSAIAKPYASPTFRSSLTDGVKPILRMPPEPELFLPPNPIASPNKINEPDRPNESDSSSSSESDKHGTTDISDKYNTHKLPHILPPVSFVSLNKNVEQDRPTGQHIPLSVSVASPNNNIKRDRPKDLRVYEDISSSESYDDELTPSQIPIKSRPQKPSMSLVSVGLSKKRVDNKRPSPPSWLLDLKTFMQNSYDAHGINKDKVKPVIMALEQKYKVHIRDIDLNANGDVKIDYVSYTGSNSRIGREGNNTEVKRGDGNKKGIKLYSNSASSSPADDQTKSQNNAKENVFENKPYQVPSMIPYTPEAEMDKPSLPEIPADRMSFSDRSSDSGESNDSESSQTLRTIEHVTERLERRLNNIDV